MRRATKHRVVLRIERDMGAFITEGTRLNQTLTTDYEKENVRTLYTELARSWS